MILKFLLSSKKLIDLIVTCVPLPSKKILYFLVPHYYSFAQEINASEEGGSLLSCPWIYMRRVKQLDSRLVTFLKVLRRPVRERKLWISS